MNKETLEKAKVLFDLIQNMQKMVDELQGGINSNRCCYVPVTVDMPTCSPCTINMPVEDFEQTILSYLKDRLHSNIMEFEKL